jgi:hypothetical protein
MNTSREAGKWIEDRGPYRSVLKRRLVLKKAVMIRAAKLRRKRRNDVYIRKATTAQENISVSVAIIATFRSLLDHL